MIPPAPVIRYGSHPDQVANLHLPAAAGGPWPCVILIHGGFWRERWDRTLMTPLAIDLAGRGYAAWNIEYRRVGQEGGGWPGTGEDVAAARDALADVTEIDTQRVVAVGHSAGGQLALWLATKRDGPVCLRGAVSLAGVVDLDRAVAENLGSGAVDAFVASPDRASASPRALAPLGVPHLLVHGADDDVVPAAHSRDYVVAAREAGDDAELVEIADAGHFDVVDPTRQAWRAVVDRLPKLLRTA